MGFKNIATLGAVLSALFGLSFLVAPGATAAYYGSTATDPFTLQMGRYFGNELLLFAGVLWALRLVTDPAAQRVAAMATAVGSAIGLAVTLFGLNTGALNAMGWSSVVIYAFFLVAWGRLALAVRGGAAAA